MIQKKKQNLELININSSIVVLFSLFCFSCEYSTEQLNNDTHFVRKEFYSNGKIKTEATYVTDSIIDGSYKMYFINGNVESESTYKNGKKEGVTKDYYPSGKLKSSTEFHDGKADGNAIWYYENGVIESKYLWVKGLSFGDGFYYRKDGTLEQYQLSDFEGNTRFIIKYDGKENPIKFDGRLLAQFQLDVDFDSVLIGKKIEGELCIGTPPNFNVKVYLNELDVNNKIIQTLELPIKQNIAKYNKVFKTVGKYKFMSIGEMRNSKNELIRSDTIYTDIAVIDKK
jgi:hypothetical protein